MSVTSVTVELHVIQSWPPSLLNRDEGGQPKETWFGGVRRLRVSSQSFKRVARLYSHSAGLVPVDAQAVRTRGLPGLLAKALIGLGHADDLAWDLAVDTVWGMGILDLDPKNANKRQTNILMLVATREIDSIAALVSDKLSEVRSYLVPADTVLGGGADADADATAKRSKAQRKADCPAELKAMGNAAWQQLDPSRSVDIALFGRMLAEEPSANVDGATDVAHSFSVHEALLDVDYFTAVDDLGEGTGAGFLDTATLAAPTLYRYATLNVGLLSGNLHGDQDLTDTAVTAWVNAMIYARPEAKHTATAAWTLPSTIVGVVRTDQPVSLANAFLTPVRPQRAMGMGDAAAAALATHWRDLAEAYGAEGVRGVWHTTVGAPPAGVELPGERLSAAELAGRLTGFAANARA